VAFEGEIQPTDPNGGPAYEGEAPDGGASGYSPWQFHNVPTLDSFKALVIISKFHSETNYPTTIASMENIMSQANNKYQEYSYNQVSMNYDVIQVALTVESSVSDYTFLLETANAAEAAGYNPDDYDVIMRRNSNRGNYAWFNTKESFLRKNSYTTTMHEIGHNMDIEHANWWKVDAGEPSWSENGVQQLYAEDFDMMANSPRGDYNAWEKAMLEWLSIGNGDYAEDVADGIYRIYPYDSYEGNFNTSGVNGAYYFVTVYKDAIADNQPASQTGDRSAREYVLSIRNQPETSNGQNNPWFSEGVILHWKPWTEEGSSGYGGNAPFGTSLVDAHVESDSNGELGQWRSGKDAKEQYDGAVMIGQTYIDTDPDNRDGNLYFTPLRKIDPDGTPRSGDEYVDVKIVKGDQSGNQSPSANWNLSATSVEPGGAITATVTATDADDSQLGYFWDFGLGTDGAARRAMPLDGNPAQTFTYDTEGTYILSCIVTDGRGQTVTLSQTITVSYESLIPPAIPSGLGATATGETNVDLSWTDNSSDETGFIVQRSTTSGSGFTTVTTTAADATSYSDSGLSAGTSYFYRVMATNASGDSAATSEAIVTTWTPAESWRNQYFGDPANTGDAADGNDFDRDGVANILERAFGTAPNDGSSVNLPRHGMVDDGSTDYLSITYRRLTGGSGTTGVNYTVDGLVYALEYDTDLTDPWSSGSVLQVGNATDNGDGTETITVRLTTGVSAEPKQFIRLNITAVP
jgi:hypothetical protein